MNVNAFKVMKWKRYGNPFYDFCLESSPSSAPLCLHPWTSSGQWTTAVSPARWAHPWVTPASAQAPPPALHSAPTRRTLRAPTTTVSSQVIRKADGNVGGRLSPKSICQKWASWLYSQLFRQKSTCHSRLVYSRWPAKHDLHHHSLKMPIWGYFVFNI